MLFTDTVFFGIDPTAGKRPFVYAAIDKDLNLIITDQGTIDDVLAFAAAQNHTIVGVCSPRRPNIGLMAQEEYRQQLKPIPNPGRYLDFRVVEYLLRQHNIRIPQTPGKEENCPGWMYMGFQLYKRLEELGYQPFTQPENEDEDGRQYVEVYPHASFCALLGVLPFPKRTLEGRIQRQLVLYEKYVNIMDPMRIFEEITRYRLLHGILPDDGIYSQGELDALVAAYTVRNMVVQPEQSINIGNPEEGQIVIPVSELLEQYS